MPINDENNTQEENNAPQPQNPSTAPKEDPFKNDPGFREQSMPRSAQEPINSNRNPEAPAPPLGWQQNASQHGFNGEVQSPEPNRHYSTSNQHSNQPQQIPGSNEPKFDENGFAQAYVGGERIKVTSDELLLLSSAKKLSSFALISAPVSLLFGGSLLSAISLVTAIIGYKKFAKVASNHSDNEQAAKAIKKAAIMPIAAACLSLIMNIVAAVLMFPILLQQIESSPDGIMSLFGGAGSSAITGGGTGTQTWG